jgi:hypothetical protein
VFLKFLGAMIHPVVRPDVDEARALAHDLSDLLKPDGYELVEVSTIGNRPVWSAQEQPLGRREPHVVATSAGSQRIQGDGLSRLWGPGALHLFMSHVSAHKVAVSDLKQALRLYGVSAFVAHEDIEPTLETSD